MNSLDARQPLHTGHGTRAAISFREPASLNWFCASQGFDRLDHDEFVSSTLRQESVMRKDTYIKAHERLMREMRIQMRLKNRRGIERTGWRLHLLRVRYRQRYAA
jgi:hypothetical protein